MEQHRITSKYKIKSNDGWKSFSGIRKISKSEYIELKFNNNSSLKCSFDHKILTNNGWVLAKDINANHEIKSNDSIVKIISKEIFFNNIDVFDLIDVDNFKYLTNNIVSHNCSFIGSANTLIDAAKLNVLSYGKPKQRNNEGLLIYHEPVKGEEEKGTENRSYFMTVDVARGQGGDNSAFTVIDISEMPYKLVARFKSNTVSPLLLPSYIRSVGKKYNDAYVLVEVNDIGSQVADILHYDLEYENLIKAAFKGHKGQTITESGMGAKRVQLGVRTTVPVKKLGCAVLKNLIEQDKLIVEDSETIDELTTFIADGQSFSADEGHTDDLVMTLVLFSWATRQDFFEALTNKDVRIEIFEKDIEKIENEILPMFLEDGHNDISEWDGQTRWFDAKDGRSNQFGSQYWLF